MATNTEDQINVKRLLGINKIKLVTGRTNAETLVKTLTSIFPGIVILKSNPSYAVVGNTKFSIIKDSKNNKHIKIGINNLNSVNYATWVPIINGEVDFTKIEVEAKKAEEQKSKILLCRKLIHQYKKDLRLSAKDAIKELRAQGITFMIAPTCNIKSARTVNDVSSSLRIKGKLSWKQIAKIAKILVEK